MKPTVKPASQFATNTTTVPTAENQILEANPNSPAGEVKPTSKSLASQAVSGLKWGSASTVANAVMQIGYTTIMARLLAPEAFGVIAIAGVILRFGSYFASLGLSQAIIQKEDLSNENIRAAFTSSLVLGAFFTIVAWLIAPFATEFFDNGVGVNESLLVPVVQVMGIAFLLNGLSSTATTLLQRNMQFKALSIIETISYVLAYLGVGIICAYLGLGVWSLVFASLAQTTLVAIGAYMVVRHNVLLHFNWTSYKPLFSYGSKMSIVSFLEFISISLGSILIGRAFGSYKLGIYDRALLLVSLPMHMLTRTVSKVIFPSFSKMQSDNEKLGRVYLSSITLLAAAVIPVCLGIAVASPEIILVLLGDQWVESIPVLQVLCLGIPLSFITMFAGIVCDAKAALNSKVVLNVLFILVICGCFYLLKDYGLVGFAFAVFIAELLRVALYQRVMRKVLDLSYKTQLQIYLPGLLNGVLVAACIYGVSHILRSLDIPMIVVLAAQIVTGALSLLTLTFVFPLKLLREQIGQVIAMVGFNVNTSTYLGKMISRFKKDFI
ncbi:lipopolysaccharide biosynthesis protein [Pontibacter rugosus]